MPLVCRLTLPGWTPLLYLLLLMGRTQDVTQWQTTTASCDGAQLSRIKRNPSVWCGIFIGVAAARGLVGGSSMCRLFLSLLWFLVKPLLALFVPIPPLLPLIMQLLSFAVLSISEAAIFSTTITLLLPRLFGRDLESTNRLASIGSLQNNHTKNYLPLLISNQIRTKH